MKRHILIRWSTPTLLVAVTLLAGCSWFHRDKVEYYKKAAETRPLDVPPDLDTPSTSKELVVPGTGTPSVPARPAAAAAATAPTPAAATPSALPPSAVALEGSDLRVADSVDSTYARVGLALERAQIGTISVRDAAAHSYALQFSGSVEAAPAETAETAEHHWYSRVLHPFGGDKPRAQTVSSALRINVTEDGAGARISVNGNADDKSAAAAVKRVIEVLRERLS